MTSDKLSRAYLEKSRLRIEALEFFHRKGGYSDTVREAQECVELLLKALLRHIGFEIPKVHDVSRPLRRNIGRLPETIRDNLDEITDISRTLRKERELSFYGTDDWIPTEEYGEDDSRRAIEMARKIYGWVEKAIEGDAGPSS